MISIVGSLEVYKEIDREKKERRQWVQIIYLLLSMDFDGDCEYDMDGMALLTYARDLFFFLKFRNNRLEI